MFEVSHLLQHLFLDCMYHPALLDTIVEFVTAHQGAEVTCVCSDGYAEM